MAETMYALSAGDVTMLRRLLAAFDAGELGQPSQGRRPLPGADRVIWGALDGPAYATTGLLGGPRQSTLNVYNYNGAGTPVDTNRDEVVWNLSPATATTDRWTVCNRDNMSGRWIITKQALQDGVIVGALTAPAAATSLLGTPQMATLNVYTFSSSGVADSGRDEWVYNFAPQAATTDRWTVCERCTMTGRWIITTQFCS